MTHIDDKMMDWRDVPVHRAICCVTWILIRRPISCFCPIVGTEATKRWTEPRGGPQFADKGPISLAIRWPGVSVYGCHNEKSEKPSVPRRGFEHWKIRFHVDASASHDFEIFQLVSPNLNPFPLCKHWLCFRWCENPMMADDILRMMFQYSSSQTRTNSPWIESDAILNFILRNYLVSSPIDDLEYHDYITSPSRATTVTGGKAKRGICISHKYYSVANFTTHPVWNMRIGWVYDSIEPIRSETLAWSTFQRKRNSKQSLLGRRRDICGRVWYMRGTNGGVGRRETAWPTMDADDRGANHIGAHLAL